MKSLLIVTTIPTTIAAFLLPYAQALRARGWRVDALSNGATADPRLACQFDHLFDAPWTRSPRNLVAVAASIRAVRKLLRRGDHDIVHVHTPVASFIVRAAAAVLPRAARPRIVYTAHGFHFHPGGRAVFNAAFSSLERLAGRWSDILIVINKEDEAAALRLNIVPRERLVYMPGIGVDRERLATRNTDHTKSAALRAEMGVGGTDTIILVVAEFNPGKRHRDALAALKLIDDPHVHLAFAGTGRFEGEMRALASESGLAGRAHFLGFRKDIEDVIAAADAILLPSEREGLPRSVMEAMCLGKAVIGTDIRGMNDLLSDGCGLLVDVGDHDGLAAAMEYVRAHPEEARAMGAKAQVKMADYDVRGLVERHMRLYEGLVL